MVLLHAYGTLQRHSQEQRQDRVNLIIASITKYLADLLSASASLASSHLSGVILPPSLPGVCSLTLQIDMLNAACSSDD